MEWDTVCSVFGVQLSGHDQQHSLKSEPDLTGSREGWPDVCLCPVVKCVIRGVRGWTRGVCANSAADNCEDTRHGWELTPCLWSVLRLHKSVQLSRATLFLIEVAQSSATLTVCLLSPLSATHVLKNPVINDDCYHRYAAKFLIGLEHKLQNLIGCKT